jgi:hypothetical protein
MLNGPTVFVPAQTSSRIIYLSEQKGINFAGSESDVSLLPPRFICNRGACAGAPISLCSMGLTTLFTLSSAKFSLAQALIILSAAISVLWAAMFMLATAD